MRVCAAGGCSQPEGAGALRAWCAEGLGSADCTHRTAETMLVLVTLIYVSIVNPIEVSEG